MTDSRLVEYIQPYPEIDDFIFVPPSSGRSRTWIYRAQDEPRTVLDYHFSSLVTSGWRVTEAADVLTAERPGSSVSVSALRRNNGTRVVYEINEAI